MGFALHVAARSDVGLVRSQNQDSAYAGADLLVVADGMGGHAGGDVASSIAVSHLADLDRRGDPGEAAVEMLRQRISAAHEALVRRVREDPRLAGMGTTVTALLRTGDRLALAHVGDSRAYLLRDGELSQVTHDHTFVQTLVDEGRITPAEAERHPQRSVIMKVLGDSDADTAPDTAWRDVAVGDRWLLCSDGLSGVVGHDTLAATLRDVADVGRCADALVQLAVRGGAPDNVTVVVADVVPDGHPDSSPQVVGAAARSRGRATGAPGRERRRGPGAVPPAEDDTDDGDAGQAAAGTAAGTAAAAAGPRRGGPAEDDLDERDRAELEAGDDAEHDDEPRSRPWLRVVGVVAVLAVLAGGAAGAWAWGRQQFFVGTAGGEVAIFRGLPQDLGPIGLSTVVEPQGLATADLPDYWRERVEERIGADDLADARQVVSQLRLRTVECRQAAAQAEAAPAPTLPAPGTTPSAGAGAAPDASAPGLTPSPGTTAAPIPSPGPTLPPTCEGVG